MDEKRIWVFITDSGREDLIVRALEKFGVDEWTKTEYIEVQNANIVTYMFLSTEETYEDVVSYIQEEESVVKQLKFED